MATGARENLDTPPDLSDWTPGGAHRSTGPLSAGELRTLSQASIQQKKVFRAVKVASFNGTCTAIFAAFALELFRHPDQRDQLVMNPDLIPNAFREGLRYGMPTQFLGRTVVKPVEIHGKTMKPGQAVLFLFPSANRDDREFEDPDRFDIHRESRRILTFGHGNHSCLGTHIAALEGETATRHLLARMPNFVVDESRVKRLKSEFVSGIVGLPVYQE